MPTIETPMTLRSWIADFRERNEEEVGVSFFEAEEKLQYLEAIVREHESHQHAALEEVREAFNNAISQLASELAEYSDAPRREAYYRQYMQPAEIAIATLNRMLDQE